MKKIKKALSALLALSMLSAAFVMPAGAESTSEYSYDFQSAGTLGQYANSWNAAPSEGGLFTHVPGGGGKAADDNAIKVTFDNKATYGAVTAISDAWLLLSNPRTDFTGLADGTKMVIETSVKADDYNAIRYLCLNGSTAGTGRYILFHTDGKIYTSFQTYGNNFAKTEIGTYQTGVWYKIALELELGSEYYSLYVNGEKLVDASERKIQLVNHVEEDPTPISGGLKDFRIYTYPKGSTNLWSWPSAISVANLEPSSTYYDDFKMYLGTYDAAKSASKLTAPSKYMVSDGMIYLLGQNVTGDALKSELSCGTNSFELYNSDWTVFDGTQTVTDEVILVERAEDGTIISYAIDTSNIEMYSDGFDSVAWTATESNYNGNGVSAGIFSSAKSGSGKEDTDNALKINLNNSLNYTQSSILNAMYRLSAVNNADKLTNASQLVIEFKIKPEDYNATRLVELNGATGGGRFIVFGEDGTIGTSYQYTAGGYGVVKSFGTYEPGRWYNIAVEIELGSEQRAYNLYINGVKQNMSWEHPWPDYDTMPVPLVGYSAVNHPYNWPAAYTGFKDVRIQTYPKGAIPSIAYTQDNAAAPKAVATSAIESSVTYYDDFKMYIGSYDLASAESKLSVPEDCPIVDNVVYLYGRETAYSEFTAEGNEIAFYDKSWNKISDTTGNITDECYYLTETTQNGEIHTYVIDNGGVKLKSGNTVNLNVAGVYTADAIGEIDENAVVILALYDENKNLVNCSLEKGTASLEVSETENATLKAFLWDSNTLKPLGNSIGVLWD